MTLREPGRKPGERRTRARVTSAGPERPLQGERDLYWLRRTEVRWKAGRVAAETDLELHLQQGRYQITAERLGRVRAR